MNTLKISRLAAILPVLAFLTFTVSCEKLDLPPGTPDCIRKKIKEMRKDAGEDTQAEVWRVTVNGEPHYYIPNYRCCDFMSELYDSSCKLVCHPNGGFSGGGDGLCPDDLDLSKKVLIWKNE